MKDCLHKIFYTLSFEVKQLKKKMSLYLTFCLLLGFPLWGSLLSVAFLLVLSIYTIIWCIPIGTITIVISSFVAFSIGIFGVFPLFLSSISIGLTQLGVCTIFAGIGVLTYMSYQKIMSVSIKITRRLKIIGLSLLRMVRIVC